MKMLTVRIFIVAIGLVFCMFFWDVVPAGAQNFSGGWFMDANGWTFNLIIQQNGNQITGSMQAINSNNPASNISGSANGRAIAFTRLSNNQFYEGYLFERNSGNMAGKFCHQGQIKCGGWYARRH
jgi:hypothetical protein